MTLTPRQRRRQRTIDWNRAIAEGRVVKFEDGFKSYRNPTEARNAVVEALVAGFQANLVDPKLADLSYEENNK